TVLRAGVVVAEHARGTIDEAQLAREMVGTGRTVESVHPASVGETPVRVRLEGLVGDGLNGLSLEVRGGEVVGVAGVAGNGQEGLALAVAGVADLESGEVLVDGERVTGSPRAALDRRGAIIPDDR